MKKSVDNHYVDMVKDELVINYQHRVSLSDAKNIGQHLGLLKGQLREVVDQVGSLKRKATKIKEKIDLIEQHVEDAKLKEGSEDDVTSR